MSVSTPLVCPKCGSGMAAYERNGIVIDQCTSCRGVFLDRGELEHLLDAEAAYVRPATPAPYRPQQHGERSDHHGGRSDQHGGRGRRGGFLGNLFD